MLELDIREQEKLAAEALTGLREGRIQRLFSYGVPADLLQTADDLAYFSENYGFDVASCPAMGGNELFRLVLKDPGYTAFNNAEIEILGRIGNRLGASKVDTILELGPGSGEKTGLLLKSVSPAKYVAIESAAGFCEQTQKIVDAIGTPHTILQADFLDTKNLRRAAELVSGNNIWIVLLGSTFGNFSPADRTQLLQDCAEPLNKSKITLLIGQDCTQDEAKLQAGYGNAITAVFFLNSLRWINSILATDLRARDFEYAVDIVREAEGSNVQMFLVAKRDITIRGNLRGQAFSLTIERDARLLVGESRRPLPESIEARYGSAFKRGVPPRISLPQGGSTMFVAQNTPR